MKNTSQPNPIRNPLDLMRLFAMSSYKIEVETSNMTEVVMFQHAEKKRGLAKKKKQRHCNYHKLWQKPIVLAPNKDIAEIHQNLPVSPKKASTPQSLKEYISNEFLYCFKYYCNKYQPIWYGNCPFIRVCLDTDYS